MTVKKNLSIKNKKLSKKLKSNIRLSNKKYIGGKKKKSIKNYSTIGGNPLFGKKKKDINDVYVLTDIPNLKTQIDDKKKKSFKDYLVEILTELFKKTDVETFFSEHDNRNKDRIVFNLKLQNIKEKLDFFLKNTKFIASKKKDKIYFGIVKDNHLSALEWSDEYKSSLSNNFNKNIKDLIFSNLFEKYEENFKALHFLNEQKLYKDNLKDILEHLNFEIKKKNKKITTPTRAETDKQAIKEYHNRTGIMEMEMNPLFAKRQPAQKEPVQEPVQEPLEESEEESAEESPYDFMSNAKFKKTKGVFEKSPKNLYFINNHILDDSNYLLVANKNLKLFTIIYKSDGDDYNEMNLFKVHKNDEIINGSDQKLGLIKNSGYIINSDSLILSNIEKENNKYLLNKSNWNTDRQLWYYEPQIENYYDLKAFEDRNMIDSRNISFNIEKKTLEEIQKILKPNQSEV